MRPKPAVPYAWVLPSLVLALLLGAPPRLGAVSAEDNWNEHCVSCHGDDGRGRTKMGRKLKIKDLTSTRQQGRMSDERMLEMITDGETDNDGGERMPAFRNDLSEEERAALVQFVRQLAGKPAALNDTSRRK